MTLITNTESETEREGERLGRTLLPGAVVALYGGLGAGKTAFTRGLALGLGISANVSSPTFTIVNEYPGELPLFHFDMYRLESESELYDIGWDEYLERGGVCAVEWSEKIPGAFPPGTIMVKLDNLGGDMRRLEIIHNSQPSTHS
jgi:tRNA threonylcarbamoyladenosine biosynthesis protein TsaE